MSIALQLSVKCRDLTRIRSVLAYIQMEHPGRRPFHYYLLPSPSSLFFIFAYFPNTHLSPHTCERKRVALSDCVICSPLDRELQSCVLVRVHVHPCFSQVVTTYLRISIIVFRMSHPIDVLIDWQPEKARKTQETIQTTTEKVSIGVSMRRCRNDANAIISYMLCERQSTKQNMPYVDLKGWEEQDTQTRYRDKKHLIFESWRVRIAFISKGKVWESFLELVCKSVDDYVFRQCSFQCVSFFINFAVG